MQPDVNVATAVLEHFEMSAPSLLTSLAWEICFPALCTRKRLI